MDNSFSSAWNIVRSPSQPFELCNTVWFPSHSPKMACCLLRALNDKLLTASRLKHFSVIDKDTCFLCCKEPETIQHLYFSCPYSAYIWSLCKLKLGWILEYLSFKLRLLISRRNSQRRPNVMC